MAETVQVHALRMREQQYLALDAQTATLLLILASSKQT
ncbi:hypothetical protein NBRC111894_2169 [Sporolactobacillus inulinus]|uniref:Uncharacterized protein n=1 Tax=Sporolactobacillus inulinus TaxID=2078 RepID=A0A4Y1ZC40_9BACL|nr:hypothetical protein NBRC111894_2169 [Sporolactobacillus inulinus]